mgnify:CR=1 FL=1|jgi:hypothetical protein
MKTTLTLVTALLLAPLVAFHTVFVVTRAENVL